jgi:hypothetical protein
LYLNREREIVSKYVLRCDRWGERIIVNGIELDSRISNYIHVHCIQM